MKSLTGRFSARTMNAPSGGLHHEARVPNAQRTLLTRLIEEQAEFHRQAGEVVQLTDAGLQDAALKRLTHGD